LWKNEKGGSFKALAVTEEQGPEFSAPEAEQGQDSVNLNSTYYPSA
jgi:predicted neuraminidase